MPGYKQEKYAPEQTDDVQTLDKRFVDIGLTSRDYVYILLLILAYYYRAQGPRTAMAVGAVAAFLLLRRRIGLSPTESYCSACAK